MNGRPSFGCRRWRTGGPSPPLFPFGSYCLALSRSRPILDLFTQKQPTVKVILFSPVVKGRTKNLHISSFTYVFFKVLVQRYIHMKTLSNRLVASCANRWCYMLHVILQLLSWWCPVGKKCDPIRRDGNHSTLDGTLLDIKTNLLTVQKRDGAELRPGDTAEVFHMSLKP